MMARGLGHTNVHGLLMLELGSVAASDISLSMRGMSARSRACFWKGSRRREGIGFGLFQHPPVGHCFRLLRVGMGSGAAALVSLARHHGTESAAV